MYKESETIELKQELNSDFKKEVIALANTKGGIIYVGIDSDGEVIGLKNAEKDLESISGMIREGIKSDLTIFTRLYIKQIESKEIIVVEVLEGTNKPYYLAEKGIKPTGVYIRHGISSVPATEETIKMMLKEYKNTSFERNISTIQDLNLDYLKISFKNVNIDLDDSKLKTLNLVREDRFTNLAFLLSNENTYTIKCGVYSDTTVSEFIDRREFSGSILKQIDEVFTYLNLVNKTSGKIANYKRVDNRDYPEYAIRESLLNASIHRSYEFNGSILIHIFTNRIEIVSLGGLVKGVTLNDIMSGTSEARNPNLANVFHRLEFVESFGTGIKRINASYDKYEVKPIFEVTENTFKVILPNTNYVINETSIAQNSTNEEKIINYIELHLFITRKITEELLNLSKAQANRILDKLINDRILIKEGINKNTRYVLKK